MSYLDTPINRDSLPTAEDLAPIVPGVYSAIIIEASINDTKSGTGKYIKLKLINYIFRLFSIICAFYFD